MFKIDYYIYKYFLTSKMAALTKICLTVIHFYTAYLKRRITSSASDSHTVLHTLWHIGPVFGVYKSSVWSMLDPLWSTFLSMLLLFGRNSNNFLTYKKNSVCLKKTCNVYAILKTITDLCRHENYMYYGERIFGFLCKCLDVVSG
jgi:hypothetical protein